ncbi:MAG: hypothetical protein HY711_06535 [Candidatus Melainabacteria bacterium]|nr:hypothetical protein [Candidatus Melainabacteria bacterium]
MKYLHSGYILFCDRAEYADNGRIDANGLFDLLVGKGLPIRMNCTWVIGFGTPYERRQYKGLVVLEDPDGKEVFSKEFNANDPNDLYRGHYIFSSDLVLIRDGLWTAKVFLKNWKGEGVWDIQRQFWAMVEGATLPDP